MKQVLVNSKYLIQQQVFEDLISFCYVGVTDYSNLPILFRKYKKEYLTSPLVRKLITISERLISVKHKHLLALIDYYYDGKYFYTIYEGVPSFERLEYFLKTSPTLDVNQLWRFSTKILDVMVFLEKQNLVAGTLNLSNLLVVGQQIKLSRIIIPSEILKHYWKDFVVVEDSIFLAPEFIQYQRYSIRSDIYSYGVLLYLFFSQKWPYKYVLKLDQLKKEILKGPSLFEPVHSQIPDNLGRDSYVFTSRLQKVSSLLI